MTGDKLNYSEIQALIKAMRENGTKMKTNLDGCNNLVKEDINTQKGIWDGASASEFATKYEINAVTANPNDMCMKTFFIYWRSDESIASTFTEAL